MAQAIVILVRPMPFVKQSPFFKAFSCKSIEKPPTWCIFSTGEQPMNTRCYNCGWNFALARDLIEATVATAGNDKHYVAYCPRCRRANKIPMERLKRTLPPGWSPQPSQPEPASGNGQAAAETPLAAGEPQPEVAAAQPEATAAEAPASKTTAKKTATRKGAAKKTTAGKSTAKKSAAKAPATKKSTASKAAAKKSAAKKSSRKQP
jgi:hypothetical protein